MSMDAESRWDVVLFLGLVWQGLSLATRLVETRGPDLRLLLIDPVRRSDYDRTWCFPNSEGAWYQPLIQKTWNRASVSYQGDSVVGDLKERPYAMIRSDDFYAFLLGKITRMRRFLFYTRTSLLDRP